jgi:hypothetical protein
MTVTIGLTGRPWPPQCYQLLVNVGDQAELLDVSEYSEWISVRFTLPMMLSWGPLPVAAQMVYKDAPEQSPPPEESAAFVMFEPEIGRAVADPSPDARGNVRVTVPVSYAARIPEFEPHFALFPERFDGDEPSWRSGCAPYRDIGHAENLPESISGWDEGEGIWTYQFIVPYRQVLDADCNYQHLRVRWTAGDGRGGIEWAEVNRDSLSPLGP